MICVFSADRIVLPVITTLQVIAYEVDMAVHLPKADSDGLGLITCGRLADRVTRDGTRRHDLAPSEWRLLTDGVVWWRGDSQEFGYALADGRPVTAS